MGNCMQKNMKFQLNSTFYFQILYSIYYLLYLINRFFLAEPFFIHSLIWITILEFFSAVKSLKTIFTKNLTFLFFLFLFCLISFFCYFYKIIVPAVWDLLLSNFWLSYYCRLLKQVQLSQLCVPLVTVRWSVPCASLKKTLVPHVELGHIVQQTVVVASPVRLV